MRSQKMVKSMVMLIILGLMLSACQKQENGVQKKGENTSQNAYVIGLDDTFAPMGFVDENGELVGFDIDLAKEIASRKNFDIRFQSIDWAMKETELNTKNIDMIWNGYSISEERKEKVAFSNPYFEDKQLVITMQDSPISAIEDIKGKKLALQAESTALDAVKNYTGLFENLGELIEYPSNNEVFQDLQTGRCDVIVVDEALGRYYMKKNSDIAFRVLEQDLGSEFMAVGLRKEDTELCELINQGLEEIKADGTYDKIKAKWLAQ